MSEEREPLSYASPENRRPAWFSMEWGGWAILALVVLTAAIYWILRLR